MLDRSEFYHGAAIVRLLGHPDCDSVRGHGQGFRVNGRTFVLVKYTTRARTPWRFQFGDADLACLRTGAGEALEAVVALVCGGDGVCALRLAQCESLLGGEAGWIRVRRHFNRSYAVAGAAAELKHRVPQAHWPQLAIDPPRDRVHS